MGTPTDSKYRSLRFVAGLIRTLALLLGLLILIGFGISLWYIPSGSTPFAEPTNQALGLDRTAHIVVSVISTMLGLLVSLLLYATGEAIDCFVDIEVNTRRTMEAIEAESE